MKKVYLGLLVSAAMAASAVAPCQKAQTIRSGGYEWGSPYNKLYSPSTVITFTGKVTGVQVMQPMSGMDDGALVLVKLANGGTSLVDLGPAWYVNNQPITINVGDRITVTGSKVIVDKRGTVLARKVQKGNDVLLLRDTAGDPLWWAYRNYPNGVPVDQFGNQTAYTGTVTGFDTTQVNGVVTDDVVLQTPNGNVTVNLGPAWFVDRQPPMFQLGSNITVYTGTAPTTVGNITIIPAWQVTNATALLNLRSNGIPVWNGWGSGR